MNLFWLGLRTRWKCFIEYIGVVCKEYRNASYRNADLKLLSRYLFTSPYTISKNWAILHNKKEIYTYGETPIPALRKIVKEAGISKTDHLFELGCGRGRACLWLRYIVGCDVTGIDCIEDFILRLHDLEEEGLIFIQTNFLKANLDSATVIYLNGTMMEDNQIELLAKKLILLKESTKILTVSYPLTDYSPAETFKVTKEFPVNFHWGEAIVYLQSPIHA